MWRTLLMVTFLAALAGPAELSAQSAAAGAAETALAQAAPQSSPDTSLSVAAAPSGLPLTAAPPRTLRAYWHVFIAFAVAWVLLFGYVVTLARRFRRLEEQVAAAQ